MGRSYPVPTIIKKYAAAKQSALKNNSFSQVASTGAPRTTKVGKGVQKSSKSDVPANRTYLKTGKTKPKAPKVSKSKLDTTSKTPFNRSSRVNYRQLRRSK